MSYNGSGTFQINTSGQPVVAGTVISSTAFNALTADLATGLSTAITKDGQTTTTARIPFAAGISSTLTTDSSSVSTGSIITAGGAGIAKNLYVGVNANVAGTLGVTGVATFSAAPIYSSLTASSAVATDASKALVSVTNTGTGNNVLATSPTLVTPILGTPTSGSLVNCTDTNYTGFKNRIINGAMGISQRNGTSTVTPGSTDYLTDRFTVAMSQSSKFTGAQSSTAPTGFSNSLIITSSSAYSVLSTDYFVVRQAIEGFNFADCSFGTASASTITLSFWVRSSLTGAFGGSLYNSNGTRSYPFTYTINAANTFEQKTITIAGDTTGTWVGATNGAGIYVSFSLGAGSTFNSPANAWAGGFYTQPSGSTSVVGTSGATWYVTGVQLEKGSTATSFDYRPYGTELALCQRYYYKVVTDSAASKQLAPNGFVDSTTTAFCWTQFPVEMRISATALEQTGTAANYQVRYTGGTSANCSSVPTFNTGNTWGARSVFTTAAVLTSGQAVGLQTSATAGIYLAWSAEL
jgi:hypothetical protein